MLPQDCMKENHFLHEGKRCVECAPPLHPPGGGGISHFQYLCVNVCRGHQVALDVARGLHFLHSKRIVHFDLKSQNILLARDGSAKIADVGLAKIMQREYVSTLDMVGTFAWAAPELLLGHRCTEKVRR
jgi:serine/threonine protein kinase